ncbi:FACT complex subunit SSRP1 [Thecamonas trahens ATCC 50062]|uniref:FACT complex subunit SSRP1 n=1 Tax=Thecamonas trahens ATCC 50062 TaxID=461836 RepID=A0A0L0DJG5_THETB|nr:FACT complex subunit SSRP1 [Thecamonas trahens ATCC 50062]KNC52452.1 FACT complex subunit SSRP1 [Thecamonas trahens ATCC 50062]|eukprot:XP_013755492.1 FACT complex subunit SSRP1 [Thecamonas trahens ATCC 50062]
MATSSSTRLGWLGVKVASIQRLEWLRAGREFTLCISVRGGSVVRLGGFKEADVGVLRAHVEKHFGVELEEDTVSARGINWGELGVASKMVNLRAPDGSLILSLPLGDVAQAVVQGRKSDELVFDFHQDDSEMPIEVMQRIAFTIPASVDENGEEVASGAERAAALRKQVVEEGDLELASGAALCTLEQMQLKTPRGRFTFEMYSKFMILRGRAQDHKIMYSTVTRLYLLPPPDEKSVVLVISLDPPIRQGQTRYPHLLVSFKTSDSISVSLNMTQDEINERFTKFTTEPLEPEMSGAIFEVVPLIIKHFVGRTIAAPSSQDGFFASDGSKAVRCSVGASDGLLFPLARSMFFIHKPALYIRFSEITSVEFARVDDASSKKVSKTCDLVVHTKSGTSHSFINIPRADYQNLYNYLNTAGVKVSSVSIAPQASNSFVPMDEIDLGVDDGVPGGLDSEDEDEDFQASESGTDSFEFASDDLSEPESDDDDDAKAKSKSKSKKKKKKKKKKAKRSRSDSDDDDLAAAGNSGDANDDDDAAVNNDDAAASSLQPPAKKAKTTTAAAAAGSDEDDLFGSVSESAE